MGVEVRFDKLSNSAIFITEPLFHLHYLEKTYRQRFNIVCVRNVETRTKGNDTGKSVNSH